MKMAALMTAGTLLAACGPRTTSTLTSTSRPRLDVDDVSFLFPLPGSEAGIGAMLALGEGAGATPGLTRADYDRLVPLGPYKYLFPHQDHPPGNEPDTGSVLNPVHEMGAFKVIGVRVDPHAKDDPKAATSRAELRLVLQPVVWAADRFDPNGVKKARTEDFALHMIYEVPRQLVPELIDDVYALKALAGRRTDGQPLGVNPVLAAEGPEGPYGTKLAAMIAKYAVRPQLRVATHLQTENQDHWTFFKTEATPTGLARVAIPFVDAPQTPKSQLFFTTGDSLLRVQDRSSAPDNANDLANDLPGGPFDSLPEQRKTQLVEMGLRIDNPTLNGPGTVDCASCHTTTLALWRARGPEFLDQADGDPNRFVVPAGLTGRYVVSGMGINSWSTRAFGYFDDAVSVTMGAINSSALVANSFDTPSATSQP